MVEIVCGVLLVLGALVLILLGAGIVMDIIDDWRSS